MGVMMKQVKKMLTEEKKNRLFIILASTMILFFIIYAFFSMEKLSIFFSAHEENYIDKQKANNLKEVEKYVNKINDDYKKNNEKEIVYYIEDGEIKKVVNQAFQHVDKINDTNYYGIVKYHNSKNSVYIKNNKYCFIKDFKSNQIELKEKECEFIDEEVIASEKAKKTAIKSEIMSDTVETGLDNSLPYTSKYYYIGKNPNNYFVLGNACYRIISISQNDTLKLIYEGLINQNGDCRDITTALSGSVMLFNWDNDKLEKRLWDYPVELKSTMEDWIMNEEIDMVEFKVKLPTHVIDHATWYIGEVKRNDALIDDIKNEREQVTQSKIGLVNNSDYAKISCQKSSNNSDEACKNNNYLYKENYSWWTLNAIHSEDKKSVWGIWRQGMLYPATVPYSREYTYFGVRPVIYLKNDTKIIGYGTTYAPYQILQKG